VLDKFADGSPALYLFGGEPIDFQVPPVAEHDLSLGVEDDQPERQIADSLLEKRGRVSRLRIDGTLCRIHHSAFPFRHVAALRS